MTKTQVKENVNNAAKSIALVIRKIVKAITNIMFICLLVYFLSSTGIVNSFVNKMFSEEENVDSIKNRFFAPETNITNYDIETKLIELGELVTLEKDVSGVERISNSRQLLGFDIFGTEKSMEVHYVGIVKAGIDTDRISVDLNEKSRTIMVYLPEARICDCYYAEQTITDEQNNIFNPIEADDVSNALAPILDDIETAAIEDGLLEDAYENAEEKIQALFEEFASEGYSVEFSQKG